MEPQEIVEALKEGEEYHDLLTWAEEEEKTDLFSAFLSYHGFPQSSPSFRLVREILIEKGELSEQEVVILLCSMSDLFFNEFFPQEGQITT